MSYNIYKNVLKMINMPYYRGLILDNPEIKEKEFISQININNHIEVKCRKKEEIMKAGSTIIFYITTDNSGITRTVVEFKKLMDKIPNKIKDIYIINNKDFSQQVYNTIAILYPQYNVMKLNSSTFEYEWPKHMLVPKHEIISNNEYNEFAKYLTIVNPINLPNILMNDAQCIWIGAMPNDIIKITRNSIIGESITYKIVIGPLSYKIKSDYNPEIIKIQEAQRKKDARKIVITQEDIKRNKKNKNIKKINSNIKIKLKTKKK